MSNILLTASADRTIRLWDARTALCFATLGEHANAITDAKFNAAVRRRCCPVVAHMQQGDRIAAVDANGSLKLWEVRTGAVLLNVATGLPAATRSYAFHPARRPGRQQAGVQCDGRCCCGGLRRQDHQAVRRAVGPEAERGAAAARCVREATRVQLTGHTEAVQGVVFSAVGDYLVSAAADQTVRYWHK